MFLFLNGTLLFFNAFITQKTFDIYNVEAPRKESQKLDLINHNMIASITFCVWAFESAQHQDYSNHKFDCINHVAL